MTKEEYLKECETAFSQIPENAILDGMAVVLKISDVEKKDRVGVLTQYEGLGPLERVGIFDLIKNQAMEFAAGKGDGFNDLKKLFIQLFDSVITKQ